MSRIVSNLSINANQFEQYTKTIYLSVLSTKESRGREDLRGRSDARITRAGMMMKIMTLAVLCIIATVESVPFAVISTRHWSTRINSGFDITWAPSGTEIVEQCEFSRPITEFTNGSISFRRNAVAREVAEMYVPMQVSFFFLTMWLSFKSIGCSLIV